MREDVLNGDVWAVLWMMGGGVAKKIVVDVTAAMNCLQHCGVGHCRSGGSGLPELGRNGLGWEGGHFNHFVCEAGSIHTRSKAFLNVEKSCTCCVALDTSSDVFFSQELIVVDNLGLKPN
ncbi:hypothetical protein AVEN_122292-1 [Araneus ventricosus]|uniref:Uncharacterized protein n=1 Tax=Araneus ventricosus TaxID=182803 RepID=A0A4Y2MY38_ARAVE|nr:hypothetical protein AVEN_122292-1 [Araneus ventricosus]